ncbi:MAG TPA: protein BatD, partial [Flavobacterium alvei]|nr:protein BatD [Flavobacterium alvei]
DGPTSNDVVASTPTGISKNSISSSEQFKYIKSKTDLVSMKETDFLGSKTFYGLLLLPFLILPLIVLLKKKKEALDSDVFGNKIKMNNKLAKKYLSEAKKQINNKEPFYVALEKAMHNFLKAKLHIETSDMSKSNIQELLASKNVNAQTIIDFITLTENCELARYALTSSSVIHQDYDKAVMIISDLEKQIT